MSSCATYSSSLGTSQRRPTISVATNSSSKKQRRRSALISPLQSSSIGNGANVVSASSKVQNMKGSSSGAKQRKDSISTTHPMIPKASSSKVQPVQHSTSHYRCCLLDYTNPSDSTGNTGEYTNLRSAAVIGSDVILPESVVRYFELEASPTSNVAHPQSSPDEGRGPYVIRPVDTNLYGHKGGMGLFARAYIPQGGVILVERPAVIIPTQIKPDSTVTGFDGAEFRDDVHQAMFSHIDPEVQEEIFALKDSLAGLLTSSTPEGIFRTNALDIELPTEGTGTHKYKGLFPKTSRCNHSCGPNAIWCFNQLTFTLTLSAVRKIAPGEEITISYINPFLPRHVRRAQLDSRWKFFCHCKHCDIPWTFLGGVAQSDMARQELSTFFEKLPDWEDWCLENRSGSYDHDLVEMHIRAVQLREKEGLEGFQGGSQGNEPGSSSIKDVAFMKHIDALVMCYGALADVQGFRIWVGRAKEVKAAEGLGTASHVKVLDTWLREPRKFHVWGWKRL
ncbi:hypothetical protein GYMLUDRAFT_39618 [Collybiopsis luxurians FD-317 M1]|nr:hypothetical protein GYMLUDRAFT_39618 [Collybiopsis luxurians FD-317 M1]